MRCYNIKKPKIAVSQIQHKNAALQRDFFRKNPVGFDARNGMSE